MGAIDADVALPGSKSLTNRFLVLAALANDTSRLRRPLRSRDTLLMAEALRSLGARVEDSDRDPSGSSRLDRHPRHPARRREHRLRAGRHGDAVPAAGGCAGRRGGRLRRRRAGRIRPMGPVLEALRALGRRHRRRRTAGTLPFTVAAPADAGRHGHARRLGLLAVRLGPAARRAALRRGRHRPPRRPAGALASRTSR